MSTLLLSLHPQHSKNILDGKKTIELRKVPPKHRLPKLLPSGKFNRNGILVPSFTHILIYESKPTASIVGTVKPVAIIEHTCSEWHKFTSELCLSVYDIEEYLGGRCGYGIKLKDPQEINPVPLAKMKELGINPPQCYRYLSDKLVEQLLN